jgi:hypothetical protein
MIYNMRQSAGPAVDRMPIGDLVKIIRQNLNSGLARMAINRMYEILHAEFPEYRYGRNLCFGDLELQLHKGIRENSPVVMAFIENESKSPKLWKWRIHFAEIAGAGAVISDMLSSIKSPDIGTWRAHCSLKEPLHLEPFGRGSRLWSRSSKPWEGSSVTLAFFGHTNDHPRRLVSVRTPAQFPQPFIACYDH